MTWIDNETVEKGLIDKNDNELKKSGIIYCIPDNYTYCIFVRKHSTWYIKDQGWRDANYPPENNEEGRLMINFLKKQTDGEPGFWFKSFIPLDIKIIELKSAGNDHCSIKINDNSYIINYPDIDSLMWDLMTGNAEEESEIIQKFNLICKR